MKRLGFYSTIAATPVLAVLRLTGVIVWSWWIVTAPVWVPLAGSAVLVVVSQILIKRFDK